MKIGIISTMLGQAWTGSEELWADMAAQALDEGHKVTVSLWRWPETPRQVTELEKRGARLMFRPRPSGRPTLNGALRRVLKTGRPIPAPKSLSGFYEMFRFRPDVILLSQGWTYEFRDNPDLISRLYASKIPLVVVNQANIEGVVSHDMRQDAIPFFARAVKVAFVSMGNLKSAERQTATALPNGIVVRNPVNMKDLSAVPWPGHTENEPWQLAMVGRLDCGHKAHDVLFEALGTPIWRERPWKLRLFGGGHEIEIAYIKKLIELYGLSDKIEFGGHVPDVRAIWKKHHLMVMPSRTEGTPLALVEAMLCGRAAVATDIAGHPEWVEEGKTGFLADAPSAPSLRAALERAWKNRQKWEQMGEAAHHAACERYDAEPGRTLLEIVKSAAQSRRLEVSP